MADKVARGSTEPEAGVEALNADEVAGAVYGELIGEQLAEERQRKASLEQRGVTVITTSASLVSLLFGLAAVVTSSRHFVLPWPSRILLFLALLSFFAAAVQGIRVNWVLDYREVGVESLQRLVAEDRWFLLKAPAARRAAEVRVDVLRQARTVNDMKATDLKIAMICELAAIFLVAASVGVILASA